MADISTNGFVRLTRGDSFEAPLFINIGDITYPIRYLISEHPDATVYLGVMECNQQFEEALIKKIYTSQSPKTDKGDLIIQLRPEETEYLIPGKYYYQIKIADGNSVSTVIPKTEFYILE